MREPAAPTLAQVMDRPEHGARSIVDLALHRNRDRPPTADRTSDPGHKGRLTRHVSNLAVRVPRTYWEAVVTGKRRMFRSYADNRNPGGRSARLIREGEEFPRPAVIYSQRGHARWPYDAALAIILAYRQEPLGAISVDDLIAEGMIRSEDPLERRTGISRFRAHWKHRHSHLGWRPGDLISVVELRPLTEGDRDWAAGWLFDRLYGDWLFEPNGDW